MPKRTDIRSILVIGAGPIIIGQACEFDYSGVQAIKALKSEGYRVILVNSNPATIMTDPELADATYIEPILPEVVEKIIEAEKPDALLPTMGGQTALNCALDLHYAGILEKHGVELIGAKADFDGSLQTALTWEIGTQRLLRTGGAAKLVRLVHSENLRAVSAALASCQRTRGGASSSRKHVTAPSRASPAARGTWAPLSG